MKLWKSKKSSTNTTTSCVSAVSGKLSSKTCGSHNSNNQSSNSNYNDDKIETISAASTATPTNQSTILGNSNNGLTQAHLNSRAMSPAQSEDSGLAADRGTYTTYATISIPRQNAQAMGIVFADRTDLSYPPIIESINVLEPNADFLAPGDKIHQIDGISTIGITNQQVINILMCHRDENALIEIEYSLPEYLSQNSLCVTTKISNITVERENGCLGLTLRGGGDLPLIVTNIRPNGPVWKTGRIKPGDRVLRVDNISLLHKTLPEAQQILKNGHNSGYANLTVEYEVSVMQTVEFSLGPLLIEIERSMNEQLGLVLSNYMTLSQNDYSRLDELQPPGIYIASILPASIADRCGALSVGDQILSVDETVIENTSYTPEEVKALLDSNCTKGYTQIQILPAHAILRRKGLHCTSPKYGVFNTLDPRKTPKLNHHTNKKFYRKSSLPLDQSTLGLCRSETIQLVLDCTHGSGICLGGPAANGHGFLVTKILNDTPAERSGCIQKGDRIVSVNKLYNLDIHDTRQLLGDAPSTHQQVQPAGTHWVELEVEFDMADSVIPASGVFNVKLIKSNKSGLGITVNGSPHGAFIITDVKPGSPAHRTGSLRAGDILLAVDSHPIQHYNVDVLLKDNKNECITLTVKRNSLPDYLFENRQNSVTYANYDVATNTFGGFGNKYNFARCSESPLKTKVATNQDNDDGMDPYYQTPRYWGTMKSPSNQVDNNTTGQEDLMVSSMNNIDLVNYTTLDVATAQQKLMSMSLCSQSHGSPNGLSNPPPLPPPMPFHQNDYNNYSTLSNQNMTTSFILPNNEPKVFSVQLHPNGGPLGITLAGNENTNKPIVISGLEENGIAQQTGQIQIGDILLAINNQSVTGIPLMEAKKLLQTNSEMIELKLSRPNNQMTNSIINMNDKLPQPQALYAKVQRRPRSPVINVTTVDVISNASSSRSGSGSENNYKTIHVTLYKDQVYDDYGFSVSDGLYEKGVYINRIRTGGPADNVGVLKPYDRIIQVNGTKTQDFDCCLTVPLIAAAGDKIDLIVQRRYID